MLRREVLVGEAEQATLHEQRAVLQRVADRLLERRLEAPAILFLESVKPLSFLASQALVFLGPLLEPLLSLKDYATFTEALANRENVEWLIQRLEKGQEGCEATGGPGGTSRE